MMKGRQARCNTVAELKEFLAEVPDDTKIDPDNRMVTVHKTTVFPGKTTFVELSFWEDSEDDDVPDGEEE